MATRNSREETNVGTRSQGVTEVVPEADRRRIGPRLTSEKVWHALAKTSFAILGYVTPSGEPRSSGVVYKTVGRRMYVAVAPDSWKAKQVAASGRVAVTVPVRRGGILSLVLPIPPATISFHGTAIVYPAGSPKVRALLKELGSLLPAERRNSAQLIEILPEGEFLTYALGVPLRKMRDPAASQMRVGVSYVAPRRAAPKGAGPPRRRSVARPSRGGSPSARQVLPVGPSLGPRGGLLRATERAAVVFRGLLEVGLLKLDPADGTEVREDGDLR